METPTRLLSVVAEKSGDVVHIHTDELGLERLARVIDDLRAKLRAGECDHDHLFTEAWAGGELTETMLAQDRESGATQVHHVKIYAWTSEWKAKHGL
jgi:hypothetical protein